MLAKRSFATITSDNINSLGIDRIIPEYTGSAQQGLNLDKIVNVTIFPLWMISTVNASALKTSVKGRFLYPRRNALFVSFVLAKG